jgi:pSer/pThr/pTyr-binding forkhead associated (FHA) protein
MLMENQVFLQDLESYNGTYLNGRRISQPSLLQDGDEVSVGPLSFRVMVLKPAPETAADLKVSPTVSFPTVEEKAKAATPDAQEPVAPTP